MFKFFSKPKRSKRNKETAEEIIGILMAMSLVSKSIARRVARMEAQMSGEDGDRFNGRAMRRLPPYVD